MPVLPLQLFTPVYTLAPVGSSFLGSAFLLFGVMGLSEAEVDVWMLGACFVVIDFHFVLLAATGEFVVTLKLG